MINLGLYLMDFRKGGGSTMSMLKRRIWRREKFKKLLQEKLEILNPNLSKRNNNNKNMRMEKVQTRVKTWTEAQV